MITALLLALTGGLTVLAMLSIVVLICLPAELQELRDRVYAAGGRLALAAAASMLFTILAGMIAPHLRG